MHDRTRYLEALALIASAFPAQLAALPTLFASAGPASSRAGAGLPLMRWLLPGVVAVVAIFALVVSGVGLPGPTAPALGWVAIGIVAAPLTLLAELGVGTLLTWRASGSFPRSIELAEGVEGAGAQLAVSTAITATGEEILFRGVWPQVLLTRWLWPTWAAALLVTLVYAANHTYFGRDVVLQKLVAGAIFFAIAVGGGGVLASTITHAGENVIIAYLPMIVARTKR